MRERLEHYQVFLYLAVIVVVFQSLVGLFGMLIFLRLIPRVLFSDRA